MTARLVALALLASTAAYAQQPTAVCKQSPSPREKALCTNADLFNLDRKLNESYIRLRADLSADAASAIQADQRQWLRWIDSSCPAHGKALKADFNACLKEAYESRIHALEPGPRLPDGALFYTRAAYGFAAQTGKPDTDATNDPGFGEGTYQWPQIDHPTSAEAAFNKAVYEAALDLIADKEHPHPVHFTDTLDPTGTVDVFASVKAANEHLPAVSLCTSTYGYGAAHPLTGCRAFNYSFTLGREITVDDIFSKGTGFPAPLIPLVMDRLPMKPDKPEAFGGWNEANLRKSAATALTQPTYWTLSRERLTLTFGQYEVAPYALGMPEVKLSWDELKPYLNPQFHPAELPTLLQTEDK